MLARVLTAALVVVVVLRLLGVERGTALVLLVGLLPWTLLPAVVLLPVALARRHRALAAVCAGLVLAGVALTVPGLRAEPLPAGAADGPTLRVVTANLYVLNPEPEAAGRTLRALRPDVLVVPELDAAGLAGLRASGLLDDLPHALVPDGAAAETVGLFSRLPLTSPEVVRGSARALPRATVDLDGVAVRVLTAHPLPPLPGLEPLWRSSLAALTAEVAAQDGALVVAGDLNAGRHHALFRRLLDAGLQDAHAARGRGLARTWPASAPLLHLDHVLVGGGLLVLEVDEVRVPGSDHLAVVADVALRPRS